MLKMMKLKKLFLSCGVAALVSLSASSAHAGPECSTEFREVMQNYANAMRVQDYAVMTAVQKQNDSSLVLTCFDDLVGVSGKAGDIFSDVLPSADMATWGAVAYDLAGITNGIGLYADTLGVTNLLGYDLAWVTSLQLDNFLKNFDNGKLGAASPSLLDSAYEDAINTATSGAWSGIASYYTFYTTIRAVTSGRNYNCNRMQDYWDNYVTEQGFQNDIPYLSYDELVQQALPGGLDTNYNTVMTSTPTDTILDNAEDDFDDMRNPGTATPDFDFERQMPALTATSSVADVIAAM